MSDVTVMIPSYNYAEYLGDAVTSAAVQPEADVVIVDNGSTDASPVIGEQLADLYDNVRFIRYEHNDGIIASFNRCRAEIRGKYATLLCADDMLTPGSLARSVALMEAHPEVALVYGTARDFGSTADIDIAALPAEVTDSIVHDGDDWIDRLCRYGRNPIRNPEAMMRSSVAADAGVYEPACPYTSDLNMWLRLAARADVAYLRGPVQALFRRHGENVGSAFPHNSLAEIEQRWTAFERFVATLDDGRGTRWAADAKRTIASDARYSASRLWAADQPDEADELLAFADGIDPDGSGPVEQAAWRFRRQLGPARAAWVPGFQLRPMTHRVRTLGSELRRNRLGIG